MIGRRSREEALGEAYLETYVSDDTGSGDIQLRDNGRQDVNCPGPVGRLPRDYVIRRHFPDHRNPILEFR